MKRDGFTVGLRNKLSDLAMQCDSCAAIEGAKMTQNERKTIQDSLRSIVNYIDERIKVK
jgi:hypothetical protein